MQGVGVVEQRGSVPVTGGGEGVAVVGGEYVPF